MRVFEGLKDKTENEEQYKTYVNYFRPLIEELGVPLPEEMGIYVIPKNYKRDPYF